MTDYLTIPDVELGHAGMNWQAVFGPVTFTLEHLADVRTAAMEDPHILLPRIKIGHFSAADGIPHFINPFEELGDAAPAMGRVKNLRLENDGAVLVGDLVDVPWWVPAHYPSRSGEWDFGHEFKGVVTPGGKRYSCVLPAMALLGEILPAISSLEDLERLLIDGPEALAATSKPRSKETAVTQVATRVNVDTIVKRFITDVAEGERYWWWPIGVYIDPDEIIADDDEGHLWRVPFTTDGNDTVTFDEPVRVDFADVSDPVTTADGEEPVKRRVYLPHQATAAGVATSLLERQQQKPLKTFTSAAQVRPADRAERPTTQGTSSPSPEEVPMAGINISALRTRLDLTEDQLPDDATPEQVNALLTAEPETPAEPEAPEAVTEPELVAASTVQVDAERWREIESEIATTRAEREKRALEERDRTIATAVSEGRIPPSRVDHYARAWDADPNGTRTLLTAAVDQGGLPKELVPVIERGAVPDSEAAVDNKSHEAYMAAHFPAARRRTTTTTGA